MLVLSLTTTSPGFLIILMLLITCFNNLCLPAMASTAISTPVFSTNDIRLTNRIVAPNVKVQASETIFHDNTLVFSRIIHANRSYSYSHDFHSVSIKNTGSHSVNITAVSITGPFHFTLSRVSYGGKANPVPLSLKPGATAYVGITYIFTRNDVSANQLNLKNQVKLHGNSTGKLNVWVDGAPTSGVELVGLWQAYSEYAVTPIGNLYTEPTVSDVAMAFGISTVFYYPNQHPKFLGAPFNYWGSSKYLSGEELNVQQFMPTHPNVPVVVTQLAAYHRRAQTGSVMWWYFSNTATPPTNFDIFSRQLIWNLNSDAQTVYPRQRASPAQKVLNASPSVASFFPTKNNVGKPFAFKIDYVWQNDTLNAIDSRCEVYSPGACGHMVRVWPVRDRRGHLHPTSFLIAMDFTYGNFDYNDNIYLVENVRPVPV